MTSPYIDTALTRDEVDATPGALVLEFGTQWCGYCQAAQTLIAEALAADPAARHIKVADGPGRALGRSYRVKLWPTLIFLSDGREVGRLVRPSSGAVIVDELKKLS